LAVVHVRRAHSPEGDAIGRARARLGQTTLALSAVLFSGYLIFVQLVVIDAICQWGVVTDVLLTAIAALTLLRLRYSVAAPPAPAARAGHQVERRATRSRAAKRKPKPKPKRRSRTR
jgi:Vitamin K epoxide reductase family